MTDVRKGQGNPIRDSHEELFDKGKTVLRQAQHERKETGRRLPSRRPPTHPGEMLLEEFIRPLGLTQSELAVRLGVSYPRLNEVVRGKRGVTADTALRLARVVGMSADFWLGLQQDWDLWHASRGPAAAEIRRLRPLGRGRGAASGNWAPS